MYFLETSHSYKCMENLIGTYLPHNSPLMVCVTISIIRDANYPTCEHHAHSRNFFGE